MGDGQDHDHYVEQLREVFNNFDSSGAGSLSLDDLSHLCQSLHLGEATPTLLQAVLQNHNTLDARVDFEQFKNALILVLSSTIEQPQVEPEPLPKPASPEIQPKFVKGSKRYGRRSTPEFIESASDLSEVPTPHPVIDSEDHYDSAIPAKRERWNAHETSTGEEYEAEGQMHLWNPDEPSTPRRSVVSLSGHFEERLHDACDDMALSWDGLASHSELLTLCEHLGIELTGDVIQILNDDEAMSVQEFVSRVVSHNKPPTPSASTPYRQLKRMHSTQPFDEVGRRIATPSALTSTIGLRLFSTLDDGTGFTPVEYILDTWMEEGIENGMEILQALNFHLDGKLSLNDLTMALENELLVTKNGIHQAALASFKAEIRHLKECVDRELREKEKIQSDLEKAERLKTQLATEVDEHHSAIEQINKLNLRKLEQDHKDKLASVRSELMKEMEQMQQQTSLQRDKLEAEIEKIREDETFLRDHLSISVKENRRLEMELLDTAEKLVNSQNHITKLQTNLDNIMKEKFGDLDPGRAELFLQEERIKQLHNSYEAQCRELQDRIDELQSELQDFHSNGRVHEPCSKPLSEELESKSPGMESDPGIGSEEVQPFSMSLEAEMRLEQLKDQHLQEMDELRNQLVGTIHECEELVEKQRASQEKQKAALIQQHQQEIQSLKEAMSSIQSHREELQRRLDQAGLEQSSVEQKQAEERELLQEEEVQALRQQLLEAHSKHTDLDDQLRILEEQQTEMNALFNKEIAELKANHADEIAKLEQTQDEMFKGKLEDEKRRLLSEFERERDVLKQNYDELRATLDQAELKFEKEQSELVQKLTEQWQQERLQLDEQNTETLQVLLEEEMLKLVKEHEEKENKLQGQWESEKQQLQQQHEDHLLLRLHQQTIEFEQREMKLKEDWEREKLQLEEDYEGMVQERVTEEKEEMEAEKEETEKRFEKLMEEERQRLQEKHQEKVKELTNKHRQKREELSSTLDKLREDIIHERSEASRLCEENVILKQRIDALKEEDLKQLVHTMENLKKEKTASQKAADDFKKQISELQSQSQCLEDKNGMLSEKNTQHISDMESLRQQLAALVEKSEKKAQIPTKDKKQLSACVSALEAELNKALDDTETLKQRNSQLSEQVCCLRDKVEKMDLLKRDLSSLAEEKKSLVKETQVLCNQLAKAKEKVKAVDETVQTVTLQSSRLKADVRVLQQQKDSLQHDVALLHKKLQNANDKNKVLEMALHSTGLQSHSKKVLREELARLLEQDQKIVKQENDRLQAEVLNIKGDLRQSREKVRQLDSTIVSLQQQKQAQSSQLTNLEKENMVLKQELEAQKGKPKGREAGGGLLDIEHVLQENENLKSQMSQLSTQLIETFQAQLVGLLPPSPLRTPRGQHREEAENMQGALPEQRAAHADTGYRRIGGL